jgi:dTDP-4-amino-4,6-dideoxygalactose transaminase
MGHRPADLPRSREAGETVLSLPIYAELTEAQVKQVAETLREALHAGE